MGDDEIDLPPPYFASMKAWEARRMPNRIPNSGHEIIDELQEGIEVHLLSNYLATIALQDSYAHIQMEVLRQIMCPQYFPQSHCFLIFKFPDKYVETIPHVKHSNSSLHLIVHA